MRVNKSAAALTAGSAAILIVATGCSAATQQSEAGTQPTAVSSSQQVDTTMHDNVVLFNRESGVNTIRFTPDGGYNITAGQPWDGATQTTSADVATVTIDAKAGRKASNAPADWFNTRVDAAVKLNGGSRPDALNFAFTGTLAINGIAYRVTMGQGSDLTNNTWWVGGKYWQQDGPLAVKTPDGQYSIRSDGRSTNVWNITRN